MASVLEAIGVRQAQWGEPITERTIFGTGEPEEITALLDGWCTSELGSRPVTCELYAVSMGCVFGLELDDGARVVVKVHRPGFTGPFLDAVRRCQLLLHANQVPCARPLVGPTPIGAGLAIAETFEHDPQPEAMAQTSNTPRGRTASATGLARVVAVLASSDKKTARTLAGHPMNPADGELYPEPHSPELDFTIGTTDAAWIDELATTAIAMRDADVSPTVIGHCDWTARNVRLGPDPDDPERVVMAFDWDALACVPEHVIVGQAAQTWCATGDADHPFPTPPEVADYVRDYERARGRPFDDRQRRAVGGAALWILCYAARCEQAAAARWPEHPHPTVARDRLHSHGDQVLHLDQS